MENAQGSRKLWRKLFPIHRNELRKFVPLATILCMLAFGHTGLRSLKEIFILQHTGVEVVYYLKLFGVTPGILVFTLLYARISQMTSRDERFNVVVLYFLAFFLLAHLVLLPNLEVLRPDSLVDNLTISFPKLKNLWDVIRYWPLSLFYIHAEAWGTVGLGVLFWTFANEITSLEQSKRLYSFLSLGASTGVTVSGILLKCFDANVGLTLAFVLILLSLTLVVYNLFARDINQHPSLYQLPSERTTPEAQPKSGAPRLSLIDSFKFLSKSRPLALIAILVIIYGTTINLFESIWQSQVKELVTSLGDDRLLANVYGSRSIYESIVSVILVLFLSQPIMNRGWRFAASVTPVIILVATVVLFVFMHFQSALDSMATSWGTNSLSLAVTFGLANMVFIKATKFILFDPTKEQAYIPLDEEARVRGKAVVDGVGMRIGRSLGSLLLTVILIPALGSINDAKLYILLFIIIMLILWLRLVKILSIELKTTSTTD